MHNKKLALIISSLVLGLAIQGCSKNPEAPKKPNVNADKPWATAPEKLKPGVTVSDTPVAVKTAAQSLQDFTFEVQRGGNPHRFQRFFSKPKFPEISALLEAISKKGGIVSSVVQSDNPIDTVSSKITVSATFGDRSTGTLEATMVNLGPRWAIESVSLDGQAMVNTGSDKASATSTPSSANTAPVAQPAKQ